MLISGIIYLVVVASIAFLVSYLTRQKPLVDLRPIEYFLMNEGDLKKIENMLEKIGDGYLYQRYPVITNPLIPSGEIYVKYKEETYTRKPYFNFTPYGEINESYRYRRL